VNRKLYPASGLTKDIVYHLFFIMLYPSPFLHPVQQMDN